MFFRTLTVVLAVLFGAGSLLADFSYQQETKITGGAMAGMMKLAGAFSKSAREPMRGTFAVKGSRMFHQTGNSAQIIDLDKETITEVDFEKKTYSTITFAQMQEAIARGMKQLNKDAKQEGVDMNVAASVKESGQKRSIQGMDARQVILSIEMKGKDQKSGQEGGMLVIADMWLAPKVPGYDEVAHFYQRMGEKMAWAPGAMMGGRSDIGKGFADLYKEASKLDGVPLLQVISMRPKMDPETEKKLMEAMAQQQAAGTQQQGPTAGQAASEAAGNAAAGAAAGRLGRLGGLAGGLGGFGRRKKQQQEEPQQQAPDAQQQPAGGGAPAAPGSLIEMTTESSNFSNASVDASKFEVPAGFKQTESQTLKGMR